MSYITHNHWIRKRGVYIPVNIVAQSHNLPFIIYCSHSSIFDKRFSNGLDFLGCWGKEIRRKNKLIQICSSEKLSDLSNTAYLLPLVPNSEVSVRYMERVTRKFTDQLSFHFSSILIPLVNVYVYHQGSWVRPVSSAHCKVTSWYCHCSVLQIPVYMHHSQSIH